MYVYKVKLKTFSIALDREQIIVRDISKAINFLKQIYDKLDKHQEHFVVLTLNDKCMIEGYKVLASGCECYVMVTPAHIYRAALVLGGTKVIVSHNHPSGLAIPSLDDIAITKRIRSAGELLRINLVDHIIYADDNYYSFCDKEQWRDKILSSEEP